MSFGVVVDSVVSSQHQTSTLSTTRPTFGVSLGVVASQGLRAPREVRDAIRHRRGMKKTRELNGVSARAMALCAVALCVTTLGAREAVQSKTVADSMLPEGHVWDMPATRVRERTRLKEKIERWAQLGVKVTVMDNETTSVSLDQGGAHGDNATLIARRLKASRNENPEAQT